MQTALLLNQPDLIAPQQARLVRFGEEGRAQIHILNARGRLFEGGGDEPELSLKWIPNGAAHYASDGVQFPLEGDVQLLLNRGQAYRLRMTRVSESFVLFFPRALTDRAWRAFSGCDENFPEVPAVAALSQRELQRDLAALRAEARQAAPDAARLEELSFAVLTGMAERVRVHRRMRDAIPAMRGRTRDELLRRVARAASYLIEEQNTATLEGASAAAALSPFHLIRVFRAAYGETPLAFAASRRLDSARDALLMTDDAIAAIALRAGYATRNAFDRAFQKKFKTTPGRIRNHAGTRH